MRLKYIITQGNGFVIFPHEFRHIDVAKGLDEEPASAGFCCFNFAGVECYGESVTLRLQSRTVDSEIITNRIKNANQK